MTKTKKFIAPLLIVIALGAILVLNKNYYKSKKASPKNNEAVELVVNRTVDGWGYQILKQGAVYIDQEYIPAIPGKKAFTSKEDAKKVGEIVKKKVINLEIPHISIQTLDSLKIKY